MTAKENKILTIGVIGRFSPEKGFEDFFHALNILKNGNESFKAIIAGDGELKDRYISIVNSLSLAESVNFVGWVNNKKDFFDKIDIFCLPSKQESFGIVLLEAMQFKKPILATDCDGPKDIFKDGINGLLCRKDDPESLAQGLKILLNDSVLRTNLSDEGYKNLIENYTPEVVGKKIESALENIIADFKK